MMTVTTDWSRFGPSFYCLHCGSLMNYNYDKSVRRLIHPTYIGMFRKRAIICQMIGKSDAPFIEGQVVQFNLGIQNIGNFAATETSMAAELVMSRQKDVDAAFEQSIPKFKFLGCGTLNAHSQNRCYHTYKLDRPLTAEDAKKLNDGLIGACLFGRSTWSDKSGHYHSDFLQCFAKDSVVAPVFNWIVASGKHNREYKD